MLLDIAQFLVGLVVLYFGAEALVRGSSSIALRLGITPLIVGCTVVAFGTSAPELVVSLAAVVTESDDISVGNIVGSNVANLALILGAASIIRPMEVHSSVVKREYPVMLAASIALVALGYDGVLSRIDGFLMLTAMAGYIGYMIVLARRDMTENDSDATTEGLEELEDIDPSSSNNVKDGFQVFLGMIGLTAGAHLMVSSAISIATVFEIPELVIGISVVAIGTSLPELATSVVAALREESDISVGNVVGSNVFNILLVLGTVSAIASIAVGPLAVKYDFWIMLGVTILIWPIMWSGNRIGRLEGALLLVGYFVYMGWLFVR